MPLKYIVLMILVVFFLWIAITFGVIKLMPSVGQSGGVKGDAFGAVNALFSGLALAGVVAAILLQSEELKLQRKELEETRIELKGQKDQLEAQVKGSHQREFDSRFFETLRLYRLCVEALSFAGGPKGIIRGGAALSHFSGFLDWKDNQLGSQRFAKTDRNFGYQIRQLMQILDVAIQMLSDHLAGDFHRSILKATCGPNDRRIFLYYSLDDTTCIPRIAATLNDLAFFEQVKAPDENVDLQQLTHNAFGLKDWQSMGRNAP